MPYFVLVWFNITIFLPKQQVSEFVTYLLYSCMLGLGSCTCHEIWEIRISVDLKYTIILSCHIWELSGTLLSFLLCCSFLPSIMVPVITWLMWYDQTTETIGHILKCISLWFTVRLNTNPWLKLMNIWFNILALLIISAFTFELLLILTVHIPLSTRW